MGFLQLQSWVFIAAHALSLAAEQGLCSSCSAQAWQLGRLGSVVVAYRLSHCVACETFPDQGSNLCPLHWQVDSLPLDHQGSPKRILFKELG